MLQITADQKKQAIEIGRKHKADIVYVNEKGEFFTNESFAKNSVGGNKDLYGKVEVVAEVKEKGTNDTVTAEELVTAIETAETVDAVNGIIEAEKKGKNRVTVIKAGEKKLETLNKAQ